MSVVDPMFPRRQSQRAQSVPQPAIPQPVSPSEPTKPGLTLKARRHNKQPRHRSRRLPLRFIIAALLLVALCLVPENIGQILVLAYAVLTILRRFSMQLTFIVAVLLLLLAPIFTWLTGAEGNGAILAGYSFMLLGLGLVQLVLAYRHVAAPRS